jgi:ribonuclease HI
VEAHSDASDGGIAFVVEQRNDQQELRPLGFYSKKLSPSERNWPTQDKELYAIVKGMEHFRHWLFGTKEPIKVWSDHSSLKYFLTTNNLQQRHARWAQKLGEYNFEIRHVKGRENRVADALSRTNADRMVERQKDRPLTEAHFKRGKSGPVV